MAYNQMKAIKEKTEKLSAGCFHWFYTDLQISPQKKEKRKIRILQKM